MSAIIIDLKDFGTRTPEQAVRIFYILYNPETVEAALWDTFSICAKTEKENPGPDSRLNAIAKLFDHLIAFTKAIHQLRAGTIGRCIICGRNPASDSS